jgi:hypothetical protein
LRDLFKKNKIITVINDNFIDGCLFGYQKPFKKILKKTLVKSDAVLTTSTTLKKEIKKIFSKIELFYPWTKLKYQRPKKR